MSGSRAIPTGWGIPVAGLVLVAVLFCLPAVAKAAPGADGAAQLGLPLASPGRPDLRVTEKREAVVRRARGGFSGTAQIAQFLSDADGPKVCFVVETAVAPANACDPVEAVADRKMLRSEPPHWFLSRAPPAGA